MPRDRAVPPKWLSEPAERDKMLTELAKSGVTRPIIRAVTGWTNNQMAGYTTRAKFKFSDYVPASPDEMRLALRRAGFGDSVIDEALSRTAAPDEARPAPTVKPTPGQSTSPKTKPPKGSGTKAKAVSEKGAAKTLGQCPAAELPMLEEALAQMRATVDVQEERIREPTSAELAAQAIIAEATKHEKKPAMASRSGTPPRAPNVQTPKAQPKAERAREGCRYPLSSGGSLTKPMLCEKTPVVYGGCCDTHARMLFPGKYLPRSAA